MRAPEFWHEKPGLAAGLLTPIGAALDAAGRLKRAVTRPYRAPAPVVCVGNLVAGGSGKTPVALSLAAKLAAHDIRSAIVMRGYGGRLTGPLRVDPQIHDAVAVGDEALLTAMWTTCWVARDRAAGVRAAIAEGAQIIILDDGFQNPGVAKDLALVVVDGVYGFGNGRLIPAGPLRERVAAGLARADAVVLVGDGTWPKAQQPVLRACLEPVAGNRFAGARLVAFAGIGRPEKFFTSLRATGAVLTATHGFPDHYPYHESDLAALRREAADMDARLLTTRKDWVRLAPRDRDAIDVLDVDLRWNDPDALDRLLAPLLARISDDGRTAHV
ncbi:MAG TPA: tetraacyldisaccharide 4'-kinase [Stellaceae bacterium]|nr:tetraacyldisaccharide 4'-kinase [Stellaceae bacterium]